MTNNPVFVAGSMRTLSTENWLQRDYANGLQMPTQSDSSKGNVLKLIFVEPGC